MLKFKLVEPFVQDVLIDPKGPNEVKQAQQLNQSELEIGDMQEISSERFVRMPPEPGVIPDTNFDTLWSMVMTLEPTVLKKKEIWYV